MRGVADQDDAIVEPGTIPDANKAGPGRSGRERVGAEAVPVEPLAEEGLARRNRARQIEPVEPRASPGRLVALDDERGRLVVESVAVGLEYAVCILDEIERERLEGKGRAEPDVPGGPNIEVGPELARRGARASRC